MNQKQGMYEYIDQNYVLAGCKMQLGLRDTTSEDLTLLDYINQIVKELRNFGTQTYIVTQLEIDKDGTPKCKLPDGFIRFVKKGAVVFVDAEGRAISGVSNQVIDSVVTNGSGGELGLQQYNFPNNGIPFSQPYFINNPFYENSPYNQNGYGAVTMNVVDGYIYFSTNLSADFIKIAYLGTNTENGIIKIPAYAELAVRYGACEMYCTTKFAITGEQKWVILQRDFQSKYGKYKAKAKVIPLMPDENEYAFINAIFNTLI